MNHNDGEDEIISEINLQMLRVKKISNVQSHLNTHTIIITCLFEIEVLLLGPLEVESYFT